MSVHGERQERQSQDADIQKEQSKLEEILASENNPKRIEELRKVNLDKVNDLQGNLRRALERIDVQKDTSAPHWREWETLVLDTELHLLTALNSLNSAIERDNEGSIVMNAIATFNGEVDEWITSVTRAEARFSGPEEGEKEERTPRGTASIFREWGVPDDGFDQKVAEALKCHTEDEIRTIAAGIALYERLPTGIREKAFNVSEPVNPRKIAGQLANGTFRAAENPFRCLLERSLSDIESQVQRIREEKYDQLIRAQRDLSENEARTRTAVLNLCSAAKEKEMQGWSVAAVVKYFTENDGLADHAKQEEAAKVLQELSRLSEKKREETRCIDAEIRQVSLAFNGFDTACARNEGRTADEAQLLFRQQVDFGQDVLLATHQQTMMSEAQRLLLSGKYDQAIEAARTQHNAFVRINSNADEVDRLFDRTLGYVRREESSRVRYENRDIAPAKAFELQRGNVQTFGLRSSLLDTLRTGYRPEQTTKVMTQLGKFQDGSELLVVEIPATAGEHITLKRIEIAYRDTKDIVRLQNGTILNDPKALTPHIVDLPQDGRSGELIYLTAEAQSIIRENGGLHTRVVLDREPQIVRPQGDSLPSVRVIDASQLALRRYDEGSGNMFVIDPRGNRVVRSVDFDRLEKQRTEASRDVLRSIDHHPLVQSIGSKAGKLSENMANFQTLLQTAMDGKASVSEEFLKTMRGYAGSMLEILEDAKTKGEVLQMRAFLERQLKQIDTGSAEGDGIERQIRERIAALDGYVRTLSDNAFLNALQKSMEVRPDTWSAWATKDGLIALGAIVAATAAIVALTVLTGGIGGAGLIAMSAVGAAGGIAGSEATKELLYQYHNREGGASTQGYRYTEGSRLWNYFRGTKLYDARTGEFVEMSLLKDVTLPIAQEFVTGFAMCALAVGAGQAIGSSLTKIAQSSKFCATLAKNSRVANSIMKWLSGIGEDVAHAPKNIKEFATTWFRETLDELKDEGSEGVVEKILSSVDARLAFLASVIVGSLKSFKPLAGGKLCYDAGMGAQGVEAWAAREGHTIVSRRNGVFDVRTCDGLTLVVEPEARADTGARPEKTAATQSDTVRRTRDVNLENDVNRIGTRARENIPKLREELSCETNPKERAKKEKDIAKAEKALEGILNGTTTLQEYKGIRDLGKALKLSIADQEALARKVLENSGVKIDEVINMNTSIGTERTLDPAVDANLTRISKQELAAQSSLDSALPTLELAVNSADPLSAMERIVAEVQNPTEQTMLRELLADARSMQGQTLEPRERALIFRETMEYLHDYQQATRNGGFPDAHPNAREVFQLLCDNQRKLAHQTIVDRKFITGSDHGVLHILESNMRGALTMTDQLGGVVTPETRLLLRQAIIDHDMGYTLSSLDATDNYFAQTKDHPLYSGIRTAEHRSELARHFGEARMDQYHQSVLDHSAIGKQPLDSIVQEIQSLDASSQDYAVRARELQGRLASKLLALADCSGTTADIKMMKLFTEPELVAEMSQLKDLDDLRKPLQEKLEKLAADADPALRAELTSQIAILDRTATEVHLQMMAMVAEHYTVDGKLTEPGASYLRALKQNFNPLDPEFAVNRDFGSHSASFEGITLDANRPSLTYGVNANYSLVRGRLGDQTATSALVKAMDDFGLNLGEDPAPTATVNGEERASYSIEAFARDLADVYDGKRESVVVKTPHGKFTFVKSQSERANALAERVHRVLQRELAVNRTIDILRNPNELHEKRIDAICGLLQHYDTRYTVDGRLASELINEARDRMLEANTPHTQERTAKEISELLSRIKFHGRGKLEAPKPSG
jgi:hypothetical protein